MAKTRPFDENPDRYERWFDNHPLVYESELEAVRDLLPREGTGLEVGVGTGRFARPFGIAHGVEPSAAMREIARTRGTDAVDGVAEHLPYPDSSFDFVLMVTTICFLDDVGAALAEAFRVIRPGGCMVIGFVDRESEVGRIYLARKDESLFYRDAEFFSVDDVSHSLVEAGFEDLTFRQTIFRSLAEIDQIETPREGHGEGSFVVVRASKS